MNKRITSSKEIYSIYNSLFKKLFSNEEIINFLIKLLQTNSRLNKKNFSLSTDPNLKKYQLNEINIIELIGLAHQKEKENNKFSNTDERKHNGIYYTNYSIAKLITKETLDFYDKNTDLSKLTFLEPCSGIGIFAISYLDTIFIKNKNYISNAQNIIDNMFFADIDDKAISLLKIILPLYIKSKYGISVKILDKNIYIGDAFFIFKDEKIVKNNLKNIFFKDEGFDIILTNPPYKLLKANSNKYNSLTDDYKKQIDLILSLIRKNKIYKYNNGTINLYKLFIEEIIENLTKKDSKIGLLIPSTLLSDKHSSKIRSQILNYSTSTIHIIPEKNDFFTDIRQAFCFFSIDKKKYSGKLSLKNNISDINKFSIPPIFVEKSLIRSTSTLQEIILTDKTGWDILAKIHKHNKIKEIIPIVNLRGELDISLDKNFITKEKTNFPLLKGNCIKEYIFNKSDLYVHNNFIKKLKGKKKYVLSDRIVCQQISNISSSKRLKFSKIPSNIILGNSCNFISLNDNSFSKNQISLDYLLGILNSFLLNWRFQLTSSNNHIGNYEINELPLAVPNQKQKKEIEIVVNQLLRKPESNMLKEKLNNIVFNIYKLNKDEIFYILNKYKK